MKPTFSIIIPTYNRGYCIWKAIQSIQKQKYPYWEILVVDDGSTDNTKHVVAQFQSDPRITYLPTKHVNGAHARNEGLKNAKGGIITYVDSDETVYDHYLSTALEYFTKNPKKVFATCNYNRRLELYEDDMLVDFTQASSSQKETVTISDFYHWTIKTCGTGIFHKRSILNKVEWDTSFQMLDDLDFILQLGNIFPNGFMHIPYALFEYKQQYGGDSICSTTSYKKTAEAFEHIYRKHGKNPLMKGQQWYPEKIDKYRQMQQEVDEGKIPSYPYRYFPQYYKKKI